MFVVWETMRLNFFLSFGDLDKMKKQLGITQLHGQVRNMKFEGLQIRLIPLFHPAAIIYNRTKLTPLWNDDMEIVKKEIGKVNN